MGRRVGAWASQDAPRESWGLRGSEWMAPAASFCIDPDLPLKDLFEDLNSGPTGQAFRSWHVVWVSSLGNIQRAPGATPVSCPKRAMQMDHVGRSTCCATGG
jgi:hypothetical protein